MALALLLMTAAFILTKTGRDALYFQERGLFQLPWAYLGITVMASPMAVFTLELMRRVGPRSARLLGPLILSVGLLVYSFTATAGGGWLNTLFFMYVPVAWGVMFSLAWLLMADLLEDAPTPALARAYARVGAGSILGGILGGLVAKAAANFVPPQAFLFLGVLVLLTSVLVMARAQRRYPAPVIQDLPGATTPLAKTDITRRDYLDVLRNRTSGLMFALAVLAALVGVLVEFQFYLAAATSGNNGRQNANFFANFYLILNTAALVVQLFVMPRLQRMAGVYGSLLILPLALVGGAVMLAVATVSGAMRAGLRVAEGGLKSSIHRSNWEQSYLSVGRARRAVAKVIIDGMGARLGEALSALMLLAWLELVVRDEPIIGRDTAWVTWALMATAVGWVALTWRLRSVAGQLPAVAADARPQIPVPDT